ncbi:MAG TPA: hypothetical protein PK089_06830 [Methanoregulaceae archaeon]|nr:hypothetical protein [Methanoregulaceae archaeon]
MCKAMNDRTWLVTTVALLLLLAGIPVLAGAAELSHPVIRSTDAELRTWIAEYESAPPVPVDLARQRSLARTTGSKSLLSLIPYDTRERNQGAVANCWVWAGTGILEAAHTARDGVRDRLSVQWFDSTYNGGSGPSWAGNGGSLGEFVRFYNTERIAVPWSNPNASYQDGRTWCRDNQRAWVPAGAIGTEPHYDLETVVQQRIVTRGVGDAAARANIKAVLDSNRPATSPCACRTARRGPRSSPSGTPVRRRRSSTSHPTTGGPGPRRRGPTPSWSSGTTTPTLRTPTGSC